MTLYTWIWSNYRFDLNGNVGRYFAGAPRTWALNSKSFLSMEPFGGDKAPTLWRLTANPMGNMEKCGYAKLSRSCKQPERSMDAFSGRLRRVTVDIREALPWQLPWIAWKAWAYSYFLTSSQSHNHQCLTMSTVHHCRSSTHLPWLMPKPCTSPPRSQHNGQLSAANSPHHSPHIGSSVLAKRDACTRRARDLSTVHLSGLQHLS